MILSVQQQQAEQSSIQKLFQLLQGFNKSITKCGSLNNLQSVSSNLDATANEIGFLLQARDLNDFSHLVNKLSQVWKELYKVASQTKSLLESEDQPEGIQQKLNLIQQTKKQLKDGQGEIGQLGGVKVSSYQTPQSKNTARQMSRQLTGLPSISGHPQTTEGKSKSNYDIDEQQRDILQEVLKQSNKLNVQIVMKRYDPKITLMISEGTDTNLDIQEAIRGFNKDYLEIKLQEITQENRKNINEIKKAISEKHEISQIADSVAADKLKSVYKVIYSKTTEMDQFIMDQSKQEPQLVKDVLDDFITHVSTNYKDIQSETFKIVARMFKEIQQKQKQEELLKSRTLQVQQPQHKKDKLSSSKRANQSSADESQASEKLRQELIEKKLEVDKKNQEIHELQMKIRNLETQLVQTSLELESMKMNVSRSEQEKAQLNYDFKKLEKQLTVAVSKTFQDEAIQCTDIGQQNLISKLQKENQQYEQKVYQLKNEINKISPRSGREYKQQNTELQDDQIYQSSYNGTPKLTSKYKSAYDLDNNQLLEDQISIDQRLDSSQQMYKNSEISNREKLDEMGFERSPTHSNTMKVNSKTRKSNMILDTRQTNSPLSNSERSVRVSASLNQTNFNQKKKKKKTILQIEEEDSSLNQSSELKKQKIQRQSFANKVTRRQTTIEVTNHELHKQQSIMKDQDDTLAPTNAETHRTQSGQAFMIKRAKSGEKRTDTNGRRIQTEGMEYYQDSGDDSQSDNKVKFAKSQTFRDQKKLTTIKKTTTIHRPSQQKFQVEPVEEIPSNITSMQSLDKKEIIKKNTMESSNDEELKIKKEQLKFSANSPIRRSSTSGPQQLQMIIKLNDEQQQQFTTYWHPRHIDQECQTDSNLLIQLLFNTISQLDLPLNVKQQMIQNLPSKIETAVGIALNQSQIIHQTGNLSNQSQEQQWQQMESKTHFSSRSSLESAKKRQSILQKSLEQQIQKLKQQSDQNQFDPPQTRSSLDQQSSRQSRQLLYTQKSSVELVDGKSEKSEILMKSKEDLLQQQLKQQETILKLEDFHNFQDDDLGYEELAKEIIANENGGQQLEQFKHNDILNDNFVKKVYSSMSKRQTKGAAAVQDLLRRFYKKNPKDPINYLEFKGFYQKIHASHKQCGFNIVCSHLQRFLMRLGYTCSLFSKRKLYKTSLSILKPFNPEQESKTKYTNNSLTNQSQSRYQTNLQFSVDQ